VPWEEGILNLGKHSQSKLNLGTYWLTKYLYTMTPKLAFTALYGTTLEDEPSQRSTTKPLACEFESIHLMI
jgi:hypothetical protein